MLLLSKALELTSNMFLEVFTAFALIVSGQPAKAANASTGVYNSSVTPSSLPWNTYNYCNAPHVNSKHYSKPTNVDGSELVYMNVMIRHHKVRIVLRLIPYQR